MVSPLSKSLSLLSYPTMTLHTIAREKPRIEERIRKHLGTEDEEDEEEDEEEEEEENEDDEIESEEDELDEEEEEGDDDY